MINRESLYVTPGRARIVIEEIAEGSEPGFRFYIMVVVSTMIASLGLVTNSTAVIIGAMLVAPLMTPIFGIALSLIRSDAHLFGRAMRAEIAGVAAAIAVGVVLGKIYPSLEPTPEMLARTQPQLFDLLVAIFSGFAGAYAMVDEKISPALPGVAIATAIVPPLANTGLCFAVGAYAGGVGSFLLFLSNFLSILLISSAIFWYFGMGGKYHGLDRQVVVKRFSLPFIGFLIITLLLTHTLYNIHKDRHLKKTIIQVLVSELADLPYASFDNMIYQADDNKFYILANVHTAAVISPTQVDRIQKRLVDELNKPTELTIQSKMAHNVSALDTVGQVTPTTLDGQFIQKNPHPRVKKTKIADSIIRNYLAKNLGGHTLHQVQLLEKDNTTLVVATINGIMDPDSQSIDKMEAVLQDELNDPELRLVVRFLKLALFDREGSLHFELTGFKELNSEQRSLVEKIKTLLENRFKVGSDFSLTGIDYTVIDAVYYFYIEVVGNQIFPTSEVADLERLVAERTGQQIKLHMLSSIATVVTSTGNEPQTAFSQRIFEKLEPKFRKDMEEIIRKSNL